METDDFSRQYGMLVWVDALANEDRTKWDFFLQMSALEFMNAVSFMIQKRRKQQKEMEQAMR